MDDKRQEEVVGKNLVLPGLKPIAVKAFLAEDNLRPVGISPTYSCDSSSFFVMFSLKIK
jgi:hypothetical protein